ncbi:hypothetical protein [Pseudovibrio sp. Ad26]|uniref:hypothetical protein n=1 Tax=Pseudovibrio sp. Ad26 TaxID=989410 RepID=UPI0007AED8A0|nr:hypothetical protein [Pseudovibrio sp. Ad26]KZL16286.1 hypothetical protein PsAD26_00324 [Pseudovibrio sp. Ad26]
MARRRYSKRSYKNRGYSYSYGRERAEQHVREAEQFSKEIGGSDKDVKEYFFSLPESQIGLILSEYGMKYGSSAEEYARKTYLDWKQERRRMSGLVAKRLFEFLPPKMPLQDKYRLAENVWRHFGPDSSHSFSVGPNASVNEVAILIASKLNAQVTEYDIPENVKNRFSWLSHGDVGVKENLLNYFRQKEKEVCVDKINLELPVLQKQVREHSNVTGQVKSIISIHKHNISISVVDELDDQIREDQVSSLTCPYRHQNTAQDFPWGWVIGIGLLIMFVIASSN